MSLRIHPDISKLVPYSPGKPPEELEREFGVRNAIKLASNENPLGPSPMALSVLQDSVNALHLYPDSCLLYTSPSPRD